MASICQSKTPWIRQRGGRQAQNGPSKFVVRAAAQSVESSVAVLKQAAKLKSVRSGEVFQALQLVFTTGTKQVRDALKGGQGGGSYFPITAAQRWDASSGTIENGIFLGLVAALTFSGPYEYKGKKLSFDFDKLKIRLGPWKFEFGLKEEIKNYKAGKNDPFFIVFYVDDEIICARGRGGGIAFWKRCDSDFDMKHLV